MLSKTGLHIQTTLFSAIIVTAIIVMGITAAYVAYEQRPKTYVAQGVGYSTISGWSTSLTTSISRSPSLSYTSYSGYFGWTTRTQTYYYTMTEQVTTSRPYTSYSTYTYSSTYQAKRTLETATPAPSSASPTIPLPAAGTTVAPAFPTLAFPTLAPKPRADNRSDSSLHTLEKRKGRSGGGGGGGISLDFYFALVPVLNCLMVWAIVTVLYSLIFLIVRQVKSSSRFVSVGITTGVVSFLFIVGLILNIVWIAYIATYFRGLGVITTVQTVFSWIVLLLLLAAAIFERLFCKKYMGNQTRLSIKQFVTSGEGTSTPDSGGDKVAAPNVYPTAPPLSYPQSSVQPQSTSSSDPPMMAPLSPAVGGYAYTPPPIGSNTTVNSGSQVFYQPVGQPMPPCLCNAYNYPHPPHGAVSHV